MATKGRNDTELSSDEASDFQCSVCKKKNKSTKAEKFCVDCQHYYCLGCVKIHEDVPALSEHHILDKKQFKDGGTTTHRTLPIERCKLHDHKPVDMFCQDHDTVGCSTCIATAHRDCRDVVYVPDHVKHIAVSSDAKALLKSLESVMIRLNILKDSLARDQENCIRYKEKIIDQIRKVRKYVDEKLNKLEQYTLHELDIRIKSLQENMAFQTKEIQTLTEEVKTSTDKLKSAGSNICQLFVSTKLHKDTAFNVNERLIPTSAPDFDFSANPKLLSLLEQMKDLGDITTFETKSPVPSVNAVQYRDDLSPKLIRSLLKVRSCSRYSVKVESDKTYCDIVGICVLEDGTIVLSDKRNSRLKRLDRPSYHVRNCCDLPGQPWQVCAISNKEVAACLGYTKKIIIVLVDMMQSTRQIETSLWCFGLACVGEDDLYVSDAHLHLFGDASVFSITKSEHVRRKITEFRFNTINNLALRDDKTKLYVTELDKGLFVLNPINGELTGKFSGSELKGAWGVCVDNSGSVLVSGCYSKNVLQFTPDGNLIGEVITTTENCQAVSFDRKVSKLILSFQGSNEIAVYDII